MKGKGDVEKDLQRWLIISENKREMKLMEIKKLRGRERIGKEENGVNFRHVELEAPDGQAETSFWHWRLGLELQKTDMGMDLIFSHIYR